MTGLEPKGQPTDAKDLLSADLIRQIEEAARAQDRKPVELLEDAVKQYLERESWAEFVIGTSTEWR